MQTKHPYTADNYLQVVEQLGTFGGSSLESLLVPEDAQYKSFHEVVFSKAGLSVPPFEDNNATRAGRFLEPYLRLLANCLNPDDWQDKDAFYRNYDRLINDIDAGRVPAFYADLESTSGFFKPDYIITNPKYPFLHATLDGIYYDNSGKPICGLEIKTETAYRVSSYEFGINPAHFYQIQAYLMVTELPYFIYFKWSGGSNPVWMQVFPHEEIQAMIAETVEPIWRAVTEARQLELHVRQAFLEERIAYLTELPAQFQEAYYSFLKKSLAGKLIDDNIPITGKDAAQIDAELSTYLQLQSQLKPINKEFEEAKKKLQLSIMAKSQAYSGVQLPDGRIIGYPANKAGARSLKIVENKPE